MIKPNFMDKLLDGVEVEWKAIWEVTTWDKKFNGLSRENNLQLLIIRICLQRIYSS